MFSFITVLLLQTASFAQSCADFSGTWAGPCIRKSGKESSTRFSLNQKSCEALDYGFGVAYFDRANTLNFSLPSFDDVRVIDFPRWESGKMAFKRNVTLFAHDSKNGNMVQEVTAEHWERVGVKLIMKQAWTQLITKNGEETENKDSSTCTLDKLP